MPCPYGSVCTHCSRGPDTGKVLIPGQELSANDRSFFQVRCEQTSPSRVGSWRCARLAEGVLRTHHPQHAVLGTGPALRGRQSPAMARGSGTSGIRPFAVGARHCRARRWGLAVEGHSMLCPCGGGWRSRGHGGDVPLPSELDTHWKNRGQSTALETRSRLQEIPAGACESSRFFSHGVAMNLDAGRWGHSPQGRGRTQSSARDGVGPVPYG